MRELLLIESVSISTISLLANIFLPFHSTFSRHGKAKASLALLIWLNENVHNFLSFYIFLAVHDVDFLATMLSMVPFKRLPYHKHG